MMKMKSVLKVVIAVVVCMVFMATTGLRQRSSRQRQRDEAPCRRRRAGKDYMTTLSHSEEDVATIRKMAAEMPAGTSDKDLKEQLNMAAAMIPRTRRSCLGR